MWKEILLLVLIYNVVAEVMAKKHHQGSTAAKKKQPHHMQDANEHDEVDSMVKKWKKTSLKKKRNQNAQRRAAVVAKGAVVQDELANDANERANRWKLITGLFGLVWQLERKGTPDSRRKAGEIRDKMLEDKENSDGQAGSTFQEIKSALTDIPDDMKSGLERLQELERLLATTGDEEAFIRWAKVWRRNFIKMKNFFLGRLEKLNQNEEIDKDKFKDLKTAVEIAGRSVMDNIRKLDKTQFDELYKILYSIHKQTSNSQDRPNESSDLQEEASTENPSAEGGSQVIQAQQSEDTSASNIEDTMVQNLRKLHEDKTGEQLDALISRLNVIGNLIGNDAQNIIQGLTEKLKKDSFDEEGIREELKRLKRVSSVSGILGELGTTVQQYADRLGPTSADTGHETKKSSDEGLNDKFMDEKAMKEWAAKHEKE